MNEKIKVLVVDDAIFMRKTICDILEANGNFNIIGVAKNGEESVKMNNELKPDVITLDIDMPVMDGIRALKYMMVQRPVPVVVVSSLSYEANVTFEAFRLGVVDFVPKPAGAISTELEKQKEYLCSIISRASKVNIAKLQRTKISKILEKEHIPSSPTQKLVIMGSSLGGPNTIIRILSRFPAQINFAILVITHMAPNVMDSFVKKLDKICPIKVWRGKDDHILNAGEAYIYSLDESPSVIKNQGSDEYILEYSTAESNDFPIDKVMSSAVNIDGLDVAAVLLTGVGKDGLEGFVQIQQKFQKTIVQNISNAIYPEKPSFVVQKGNYQQLLHDTEISEKIVAMMKL